MIITIIIISSLTTSKTITINVKLIRRNNIDNQYWSKLSELEKPPRCVVTLPNRVLQVD